MKNIHIYIIALLCLASGNLPLQSQTCNNKTGKTLTQSQPETAPCATYLARDEIKFLPGFTASSIYNGKAKKITLTWNYSGLGTGWTPNVSVNSKTATGIALPTGHTYGNFVNSVFDLISKLSTQLGSGWTVSSYAPNGTSGTITIENLSNFSDPTGNFNSLSVVQNYETPGTATFNAKVDNSLLLNADYVAAINPDTRAINTSLPVGSLAGEFGVSATGAATYNIPIAVPPGTMGMQPQINIFYNSQASNGIVGKGWDIGGLSVISRVPKTLYHNNQIRGIEIDNQDIFALDGNRLVLSNNKTYGEDLAEYKTEEETFSRIISHGQSGNGPSWFEVITKDGKIIEYGNTGGSAFNPSGDGALYWCISKITDNNGNYILFNYHNINGEFWIERINYTGTKLFSPYNSIRFTYEKKLDPEIKYVKGATLIKNNSLLAKIETFSSDKMVKRYIFNYSRNFYSYLTEIIEQNGDGSKYNSTICKWPTTYQQTSSNLTLNGNYLYRFADFNGDGISDYLVWPRKTDYSPSDKIQLYMSSYYNNTVSYTKAVWEQALNNEFLEVDGPSFRLNFFGGINCVDFNGDGKSDFVKVDQVYLQATGDYPAGYYPKWVIFISNGSSFTSYPFGNLGDDVTNIGDFNGDGKTDILKYNKKGKYGSINHLSGSSFVSYASFQTTDTWEVAKVVDFNGNGKHEVLVKVGSTFKIYELGNSISGGLYTHNMNYLLGLSGISGILSYTYHGDFNGDGKTDHLKPSTNGFRIMYSNGEEFVDSEIDIQGNSEKGIEIYDFNGDGVSDILFKWGAANAEIVFVNNGTLKRTTVFNDANNADGNNALEYDFGDFTADGRMDIVRIYKSTTTLSKYTSVCTGENNDLVTQINNGVNLKVVFNYKTLAQSSLFYSKTGLGSYPVLELQGPFYAVSSIKTSNGKGSDSETTYSYSGAYMHMLGKGLIGFQSITNSSNDLDLKSVTTNTYDFIKLRLTKQTTSSGTLANYNNHYSEFNYFDTIQGNNHYSHLTSSVVKDNLTGITVTSTYTYEKDANKRYTGNLLKEEKDFGGDFQEKTEFNDYVAAGSSFTNKPSIITKSQKHPDDSKWFIAKKYMSYDLATGNLLSSIENYGLTGKEVTTSYSDFNDFGQPTQIKTSAPDVEDVIKTFTYEPKGRYIQSEVNSIGTILYEHEDNYGNVISIVGVDGNVTTNNYDSFGNLKETTLPDGTKSSQSLHWVTGTVPANAVYYSYSTGTGKPWSKIWYDILGRTLRNETVGYNNLSIYSDIIYNSKAQIQEKSSYMGSVQTEKWTYGYSSSDGRITSETSSFGKSTTYAYSGKQISTTSDGKTYKKTLDNWGNVKTVVEPSPGTTINYVYKSNGKPSSISTSYSNVSMSYDEVGNQLQLVDPDAGTINYVYDAYGRLTYQKDNKANEYWLSYDSYGRLSYKKNKSNEKTEYEYYNSGNGIGQVKKITAPNNTYIQYEYDKYGRITKTSQRLDATTDIDFSYSFDANGNVNQVTYPGSYVVTQGYDSYGNLTSVSNGSTSIWTLDDQTATKLKYTYGNGQITEKSFTNYGSLVSIVSSKGSSTVQSCYYDFNPLNGMLRSREDRRTGYGLKEAFTYDNMYRLTNWDISKGGTNTGQYSISYKTDVSGNIDVKSGIGNYNYIDHPHAIDNLLTVANSPVSLNSQNITYTDFNKIATIEENTNKLSFNYGPDEERVKTELKQNNTLKYTSYYAGLYEKRVVGNNATEYLYIPTLDGISAVVIKHNGGAGELNYLHKDHLGSIICITDVNGAIKEQYSYDPWGRRRNPADWSFSNVQLPTILTRGFTGHEHLEEFALINMNGRVYDPVLGMFLSPDNYVQAPDLSLSLNRYSYCLNNPLIYTDPSGEFWQFIIGAALGAYNGGVMANNGELNPVKWNFGSGQTWGYMLGGAVVGGISGGFASSVSKSGIPFANTAAIMAGSYTNSVGMNIVTGGKTPISMSFGVASYNFTSGEWGYLGKKGNSALENIGYGLGAMANLADINQVINSTQATLYTEKGDAISHSAIADKNGNSLMSYGPNDSKIGNGGIKDQIPNAKPILRGAGGYKKFALALRKSTSDYHIYKDLPVDVTVNKYTIGLVRGLGKILPYQGVSTNCVNMSSLSLWLNGIPNIGLHPYLLYATTWAYSAGIRPDLFSYYLNNR